MNLWTIIRREFGYLTNEVKWRKIAFPIVLLIHTYAFLSSIIFENNIIIGRFFAIFMALYVMYIMGVNILVFKTHHFKDIPNDVSHTIMLSIVNTLWNRAQIVVSIIIISFGINLYLDNINVAVYIFNISTLLFIFYAMTLNESVDVFIKLRQFGLGD